MASEWLFYLAIAGREARKLLTQKPVAIGKEEEDSKPEGKRVRKLGCKKDECSKKQKGKVTSSLVIGKEFPTKE